MFNSIDLLMWCSAGRQISLFPETSNSSFNRFLCMSWEFFWHYSIVTVWAAKIIPQKTSLKICPCKWLEKYQTCLSYVWCWAECSALKAEALYPLIENDTYHIDGKPHIFCCLTLGKLMSNFHREMICNRTSCVHDIVEFMVDHWIRIKLFSIHIRV